MGTPGFRTRQITWVTTRLAPDSYPVTDLAAWSRQRWPIDPSRAHLKTTLPMDVRHGQTVPGVRKALPVCASVDHLVRMVMWHAARRQHINVERLSCLDALRGLGAPHPGMSLMALMVNPKRPHRGEPRVKKRRAKSFPVMIKPRQELRQQVVQQGLRG
jgi:hypothetical protein